MVSSEAIIGNNVTIRECVIIEKNTVIEDDCYLDYGCVIRENSTICKGSYIGPRCIIGEFLMDFHTDRKNNVHETKIGKKALIRSNTVIYGDCIIGDKFQTGHNTTIREKSVIGNNVSIGTNSDIQGNCEIGNYVRIHSGVFVSPNTVISDFVWIMPDVTITNDPYPPSNNMAGVLIEDYVVVAAKALILPGIKLSKNCLVGAGAVVTKDVEEGMLVVGNPARKIKSINDIYILSKNQKCYPWYEHFNRGMPWELTGYEEWKNTIRSSVDD